MMPIPKANVPIADKPMSALWYRFFTALVAAIPSATGNITTSSTITVPGRFTVDTSGGDVTVTPQAFPVTLVKTSAANDVIIAGLDVNGVSGFTWNTQWQAYTIDIIDGVGVAF